MADIGKRVQGNWTKDQENELRELSQIKNISAREIAERMTSRTVGKNAVVSKLANMHIHLPQKHKLASQKAAEARAKNRAAKPSPEPKGFLRFIPNTHKIHKEPTSPDGIIIDDLTATSCRWPLGSNPVKYCGKFRKPGQAYCETHRAVAVGTGKVDNYVRSPVAGKTWRR
jgi:hypothetical protein